jgi:hypothetical protein
MHTRTIWPYLAALIMLLPSSVTAQYHSDEPEWWYEEPSLAPSGPPEIVFPVQGGASFSDDFGDGRSGGRLHEGNDLIAPKMTPIIAAFGGRVTYAPTSEPSYGFMLSIAGDDGYKYNYLHINNDTPGTDDGNGGPQNAYAPGISDGVRVTQGQHIAWVGDSGNAERTVSHLHFEIRQQEGAAVNPYQYLLAATQQFTYDRASARETSPTINADKGLTFMGGIRSCDPGSLIRIASSTSVYYCGENGKRYVFPNAKTYATWYADFSGVRIVSDADMAAAQLGGNVTYAPGVKLVKITTDPKVYAVDRGGTLRWLQTSEVAAKHFGAGWATLVEDVPDTFFMDYKVGNPITQ